MLHWKNIPINRLSEDQLRQALTESVTIAMQPEGHTGPDSPYYPFIFGLLTGAIVSGTGILLASLV